MLEHSPAEPNQAPGRARGRQAVTFSANASIARRLLAAQIAIAAALDDPAIQEALAAYGYTTTRLLEGQALYQRALALTQQQRAAKGARLATTDARRAAHAQAHTLYMRHVGVARVALRGERGAAEKLDLAAPRKQAQAGWLLQAQQFYANALADIAIVNKLTGYGVTQEQLEAGQELVARVAATTVARQQRAGAAKESTRERDAALEALNRWMRDFVAIARLALAGQPRGLDRLGLVVARP
jgi:hypothetical protein